MLRLLERLLLVVGVRIMGLLGLGEGAIELVWMGRPISISRCVHGFGRELEGYRVKVWQGWVIMIGWLAWFRRP